jgi:hypothetical protein
MSRLTHKAKPQTNKIAIAIAILLGVKKETSCTSVRSFMDASWKTHSGEDGGPVQSGERQHFQAAITEDITATMRPGATTL